MAANRQNYDLRGISMTEEAFERLISVESPYRYELIDGVVYDMTGSSPPHSGYCKVACKNRKFADRRAY